MRCISPITLKDKAYHTSPKPWKKYLTSVPCGKCGACLNRRQADWAFRLSKEDLKASTAFFLTLTYENIVSDGIMYTPRDLNRAHLRDFHKRLRYHNQKAEKVSQNAFKYYSVGEYGSHTSRPHYHSIIFNLSNELVEKIPMIWGLGKVDVGNVTPASIAYVTKYITSTKSEIKKTFEVPEFSSMSPGLGKQYIDDNRDIHVKAAMTFVKVNGYTYPMPRFYRDRIFTPTNLNSIMQSSESKMIQEHFKKIEKLAAQGHSDPEAELQRRDYVKSIQYEKQTIKKL